MPHGASLARRGHPARSGRPRSRNPREARPGRASLLAVGVADPPRARPRPRLPERLGGPPERPRAEGLLSRAAVGTRGPPRGPPRGVETRRIGPRPRADGGG